MGAPTTSAARAQSAGTSSDTSKLSKASIFFLGVDGIIGSGIFLLPGSLYKNAGTLTLGLILLGAVAVLLFGFCYAEMAARTTGNGGAWLYAYNSIGEFAGFQVGLFTWIQGVATIATETAAFITTMSVLYPNLKVGSFAYNNLAIIIILITIGIGIMGEKVSKVADNASSILKIAALIIFVIGGVRFFNADNFTLAQDYDFSKVNTAFVSAFYLYAGFSFLPVAAQRMEDPQKNLPKILTAVLVFCSVIFVLVILVVIGDLGPELGNSTAPLALVFAQHYGYFGKMIIILGMAGSILGVVLSMSYSTPFIASSLANEHQLLPAFFGKSTKGGTPYVSIALTGFLAIILALTGGYLFLVPLCVLIGLVQYTTTAIAAYKIQKQKPEQGQDPGYRLKFGVVIPVAAMLFCVYMLVNMEPKVLELGAVLFLAGIIIYFAMKMSHKKHPHTAAGTSASTTTSTPSANGSTTAQAVSNTAAAAPTAGASASATTATATAPASGSTTSSTGSTASQTSSSNQTNSSAQ